MSLPQNFAYLKLTSESKEKLEARLSYKYNNHFGLYITLDWDNNFGECLPFKHQKFEVIVDKACFDDKIQAIPVDLSKLPIFSINKYPHITWPSVDGINPYYSNYMLYIHDGKSVDNFAPLTLETILKIDL
jgi:hypothetical protein